MVKAEFLNDLDTKQLKEISQQEGLATVPKNYQKEDFVKFLEGVLTREKVKYYKKEYAEREIERDIHIHEKIKEKRTREENLEVTKTTISKHEVIFNLQKERINKYVYEPIANYLHEPIPAGSGVKLYDNMSDRMRRYVHTVFVDGESDKSGRNFEFRSANWLAYNVKGMSRIETRHTFPEIGEIDIVGYDEYDYPFVIAECKDRSVEREDIDKWMTNVKNIADEFGPKLIRRYGESHFKAFFFSSGGYTQGVIDRVKTNNEMSRDGTLFVNKGFLKDKHLIDVRIYDIRNGKFMKVFP